MCTYRNIVLINYSSEFLMNMNTLWFFAWKERLRHSCKCLESTTNSGIGELWSSGDWYRFESMQVKHTSLALENVRCCESPVFGHKAISVIHGKLLDMLFQSSVCIFINALCSSSQKRIMGTVTSSLNWYVKKGKQVRFILSSNCRLKLLELNFLIQFKLSIL